jgi:hypothetical protein
MLCVELRRRHRKPCPPALITVAGNLEILNLHALGIDDEIGDGAHALTVLPDDVPAAHVGILA